VHTRTLRRCLPRPDREINNPLTTRSRTRDDAYGLNPPAALFAIPGGAAGDDREIPRVFLAALVFVFVSTMGAGSRRGATTTLDYITSPGASCSRFAGKSGPGVASRSRWTCSRGHRSPRFRTMSNRARLGADRPLFGSRIPTLMRARGPSSGVALSLGSIPTSDPLECSRASPADPRLPWAVTGLSVRCSARYQELRDAATCRSAGLLQFLAAGSVPTMTR